MGKPIIEWLNGKCKKLDVFHSKSDLNNLKDVDLIITGVGKAGLIKPEMLKPGAGVIDFGYSFATRTNADLNADLRGKIFGDFDPSNVTGLSLREISRREKMSNVAFYTPTPGGTGPILVAEIFKNFYKLTGY